MIKLGVPNLIKPTMQTNRTNELSCSVFGHNLERSSVASHTNRQLVCKTCNSNVSVTEDGDFNMLPFKNRDIKTALRQLFILKNQNSNRQFSV